MELKDKKIQAYKIETHLLPLATKLMNQVCYWDGTDTTPFFKSRVIGIITDGENNIVLVKIYGDYPYMYNEWKQKLHIETE